MENLLWKMPRMDWVARTNVVQKLGRADIRMLPIFSLHPVKSIAAGEGGVVTTNDSGLYEN